MASGSAMAEPMDVEMLDSLEQQDDPEVLASQSKLGEHLKFESRWIYIIMFNTLHFCLI